MPRPLASLRARFPAREPKLPGERDWERSAILHPRPAPRVPPLIGDGAGLPFPPAALTAPAPVLDPEDPAVGALLEALTKVSAKSNSTPAGLDGWVLLARTEAEALFARGVPPKMVTVAVRQDRRRETWACFASGAARPLRAIRNGIRASSWRLDPTHQVEPDDTMLRVLVTEQAFAGGQRANGRVLEPDLFVDDADLILTMFVTPKPGFQNAVRNPETPVRVALPRPVGARRVVDGALTLL